MRRDSATYSGQADFVPLQQRITLFADLIGRSGCGREAAWDAACSRAAESAQADFVPL
jgi:hypothetical protein